MAEATRRPWQALQGSVFYRTDCIAICDTDNASPAVYQANADMIVRAVNAHDDLVAALSDTLNMLRATHMHCGIHHDSNKRVIKARAALARASGEQP